MPHFVEINMGSHQPISGVGLSAAFDQVLQSSLSDTKAHLQP